MVGCLFWRVSGAVGGSPLGPGGHRAPLLENGHHRNVLECHLLAFFVLALDVPVHQVSKHFLAEALSLLLGCHRDWQATASPSVEIVSSRVTGAGIADEKNGGLLEVCLKKRGVEGGVTRVIFTV